MFLNCFTDLMFYLTEDYGKTEQEILEMDFFHNRGLGNKVKMRLF